MNTEILSTHTPPLFTAAVKRAAALLRAGEVVALPTETVYGLAANALNEAAVGRIFEVKGRPTNNPIIVHVATSELARACVKEWTPAAEKLARAFWPGPLTLVLPRAPQIPLVVTAGGETVGVRWPAHPLMQAVIRECGFPLAAPSANLSNQISPTNAEHVRGDLDGKIPLIVDGGQAQVGIESTVLDLTVTPARILRPGMIHAESVAAAGVPVTDSREAVKTTSLRSPGMLKKHYSPKAKLVVLSWRDEADLRVQIGRWQSTSTRPPAAADAIHIVAHTNIPAGFSPAKVSVIPHDAEAFARALYGELHRCDSAGAGLIVVEAPPDLPDWAGIADRLRRAAA